MVDNNINNNSGGGDDDNSSSSDDDWSYISNCNLFALIANLE